MLSLSLGFTCGINSLAIAADVNVSGISHASTSVSAVEQSTATESKKRLLQQEKQKLEREKHEYHNKAAQLRKKEDQAYKVLNVIQQPCDMIGQYRLLDEGLARLAGLVTP